MTAEIVETNAGISSTPESFLPGPSPEELANAVKELMRVVATAAVCAFAVADGARVIRVHDARMGRQASDLATSVASFRTTALQ